MVDSLQWISKPIWLLPTSLYKLCIYIGAEHMKRGNWYLTSTRVCMRLLLFLWPFSKVHSTTGLSTSKLIPYSHEFSLHFSSSLRSEAQIWCAAGWDVCHGLFLFPVRHDQFDLGHFFFKASWQCRSECMKVEDTLTQPLCRSSSFVGTRSHWSGDE